MARYSCTFIVITLFVLIDIVTPLQCYVCTSVNKEDKCEDYFNITTHTVDTCDSPDSYCYKQILPQVGKSPISTHRGCADPEYCKLYKSISHHCSLCKENSCNAGINIQASLISTIAIFYTTYQSFCK